MKKTTRGNAAIAAVAVAARTKTRSQLPKPGEAKKMEEKLLNHMLK